MLPREHVVVSASVGAVTYAVTGSPVVASASFLSGILIDLDHVVDFIFLSGEKLTVKNFFSWCLEARWQRICLVLHSYEIYALLVAVYFYSGGEIFKGILIGMGTHLLQDQIGNIFFSSNDYQVSKFFYFMWYRVKVGFRKEFLLKKLSPAE